MRALILIVALLFSRSAFSHGLELTTVKVTLRSQNHLSIRIETDLAKLAAHMDWPGKPQSLMHMAMADQSQVIAFRKTLLKQFSQSMPVHIGNKPMQNQKARTVDSKRLGKLFKALAAEQLMPKEHSHSHDNRQNFLVINIDGFIDKTAQGRELKIDFPAALGPVMVSYSKPQVQTLKAGDKRTVYRQLLD